MSRDQLQACGPSDADGPCLTTGGFRGEYFFLSNFYPCEVRFDGLTYKCSEAAYAAQKTLDLALRRQFQDFDGPTAKREGSALSQRSDWDSIRLEVMRSMVRAKFTQNPELAERLLATGEGQLVEINTWEDRFWGVCEGVGENWLGRILMEVRAELRHSLGD